MTNRRAVLGLLGAAAIVASAAGWNSYSSTLAQQRARIGHGSEVMQSPFGQIEYAVAGSGKPVLVIHGAGGGFDQGLSLAGRFFRSRQIIAPSRFGYLRSENPGDASPENQADAFALLLDQLHVNKVDVVGISAGAGSALQFAIRHPERCRSLTLIVPGVSVKSDTTQKLTPDMNPLALAFLQRMTQSDFLFWLGGNLAHDSMVRNVLATDPKLYAAASKDERENIDKFMWEILPISVRSNGLANDATYPGMPYYFAFEKIKAPTLVISLEDDFYRTLEPARVITAKISGARLVVYPTGGHVLVGREDAAFGEVSTFLAGIKDSLS